MNGDHLQPIAPGAISPLIKDARAINDVLASARDWKKRDRLGSGAGPTESDPAHPASLVYVRNDTGGNLDTFNVVALGEPINSAITYEHEARQYPLFPGTAPAAATDAFAVLIEPLGTDKIGLAAVIGVVPVDLNVTDATHTHAAPAAGVTATLASGTSGPAKIIWKASGTGTKRAVVILQGDMGGFDGLGAGATETTATPVNGDPATQTRQYADPTATAAASHSHQFQQSASDGDGAGNPAFMQAVYPTGTGGAVPWFQTISAAQYQQMYAPGGATASYATVLASGGQAAFVTGNAAATQGQFLKPTVSSGNVTQFVQEYKVWDAGGAAIRTGTITYTATSAGVTATFAAGYTLDLSAAGVTLPSAGTAPTMRLVGTITHTDLTDADNEQIVTLATQLPAKGFILGITVRTRVVASGGDVTVLTVIPAFDVLGSGIGPYGNFADAMIADTLACWVPDTGQAHVYDWNNPRDIGARFLAGGGETLSSLTGGAWDVYAIIGGVP